MTSLILIQGTPFVPFAQGGTQRSLRFDTGLNGLPCCSGTSAKRPMGRRFGVDQPSTSANGCFGFFGILDTYQQVSHSEPSIISVNRVAAGATGGFVKFSVSGKCRDFHETITVLTFRVTLCQFDLLDDFRRIEWLTKCRYFE